MRFELTFRKILPGIRKLWGDEDGATLAEYALLTAFVGLAAFVILKLFPAAIRAYLSRIYFVVSLPIP
jgi:Flp pilus assembly pilin Flp